MNRSPITLAISLMLCACESGGASTAEIEAAAIERARDQLQLAASVPLEAKVWVGTGTVDGQPVLCGTVSDRSSGSGVPPQRFAAVDDPIEWLVFEDAHAPTTPSQPDKFREWGSICSGGEPAATPTSENNPCGTRIDANQNGLVEEAEYGSFTFAFDDWDTNDDQAVSNSEFARCWTRIGFGSSPSRAFGMFDTDSGSSLSQEEFFASDRFEQFAELAN